MAFSRAQKTTTNIWPAFWRTQYRKDPLVKLALALSQNVLCSCSAAVRPPVPLKTHLSLLCCSLSSNMNIAWYFLSHLLLLFYHRPFVLWYCRTFASLPLQSRDGAANCLCQKPNYFREQTQQSDPNHLFCMKVMFSSRFFIAIFQAPLIFHLRCSNKLQILPACVCYARDQTCFLFSFIFALYAADSENDSGYDPSQYSNSMPLGSTKARSTIEGFFDSIDRHMSSKGIEKYLICLRCTLKLKTGKVTAGTNIVKSCWIQLIYHSQNCSTKFEAIFQFHRWLSFTNTSR